VNCYRLSTLAESDLEAMWLFVARDRSVEVANRLVDDITDRFVLLASHPDAGRLRDEIAAGLRSFPVRHHIIYDRPEPGHVLIARILHGSRDQSSAVEPQGEESDDLEALYLLSTSSVSSRNAFLRAFHGEAAGNARF
jgi:toxin ParE1/3/4